VVNKPQLQLTACISNSGFSGKLNISAINKVYLLIQHLCFISATTHTRKTCVTWTTISGLLML